jgi:hypothetical protein
MNRVWVAQCLCPARHCILAAAGLAANEAEAAAEIGSSLVNAVGEALRAGLLNPRCGLCRADTETWSYEVGRTRFSSMEEAAPLLQRLEDEQAAARAAFGDMKRSD